MKKILLILSVFSIINLSCTNLVPASLLGVTAAAGNAKITISSDIVDAAVSYNLYWGTSSDVTTESSSIKNVYLPYTHLGLENGTTYYYRVTMINGNKESDMSGEVSASPIVTALPSPEILEATSRDGQIELNWQSTDGAYLYNLYWNTSAGVTTDSGCILNVSMPFVHSGLINGIKYYYRITAVNIEGESALSDEISSSPRVLYLGQLKKLLSSDGETNDRLGYSVSISGDYAIAGVEFEDEAGTDAGAAYIFHRSSENSWDGGTKLLAPDGAAGDAFGKSVSISGDYAIVGASGEDEAGSNAGAAYIYHRIGDNSWDGGTKLLALYGESGDAFGESASICDDYAIVGASGEDDAGNNAGAAFIYHRIGDNSWDGGTKLLASGGTASDYFGGSVSISGDHAIVGAIGEDEAGSYAGAAYIFQRTGNNSWDESTKLLAIDGESEDYFGGSVSISGDHAIVGAKEEDEAGTDAGAAYTYHCTGGNSWNGGTKLLAPDGSMANNFGGSVSISGDYAVVGAHSKVEDGVILVGAAYIYYRIGGDSWNDGMKIRASDRESGDTFGRSVSIGGDFAIVGASGEDEAGADAGAAYIF